MIRVEFVFNRLQTYSDFIVLIPRREGRMAHVKNTFRALKAGIRGFVCLNDVTARDLQRADGQWSRAKGFDTFCPVGPRVAEGLNWRDLEVLARVNGIERQRGRASEMVFPIPDLLSYISHVMTLEPGDLVATGTPSGVGPIRAGDVVEVEIPGVGVLRNPVEALNA